MRFSARGRYGIRAMIDIALQGREGPVSARAIAERQEFSPDYLEQILRQLRRRGLVRSTRGPKGGYLLARPAEAISVWDIIQALDEPVHLAPCFARGGHDPACPRVDYCAAHLLWAKVGESLRAVFVNATLADIVAEARCQVADETGSANSPGSQR